MRGQDQRLTRLAKHSQPFETLLLETSITNRQNFIKNQNLGVKMHGHRKGQAQIHPARVRTQWLIDEVFQFGEGDNFCLPRLHLPFRQAVQQTRRQNILTTSEILMKSAAEFEQSTHETPMTNTARRGLPQST